MPTLFFIHHHLHSPAYTSRLKSRRLSLLINTLEHRFEIPSRRTVTHVQGVYNICSSNVSVARVPESKMGEMAPFSKVVRRSPFFLFLSVLICEMEPRAIVLQPQTMFSIETSSCSSTLVERLHQHQRLLSMNACRTQAQGAPQTTLQRS